MLIEGILVVGKKELMDDIMQNSKDVMWLQNKILEMEIKISRIERKLQGANVRCPACGKMNYVSYPDYAQGILCKCGYVFRG